jgi:hypothetical protein
VSLISAVVIYVAYDQRLELGAPATPDRRHLLPLRSPASTIDYGRPALPFSRRATVCLLGELPLLSHLFATTLDGRICRANRARMRSR